MSGISKGSRRVFAGARRWLERGTWIAALGAIVLAIVGARPALAVTAVGGFGLFGAEKEEHAVVLDTEYRFAPRRFGVAPVIGAAGTSDGAVDVRAGLGRDFPLG